MIRHKATEIDNAMQHPDAVYAEPEEVMADTTLSYDEKMKVLQNWADETKQLLEAEAENMPPERPEPHHAESTLQKINTLIETLEKDK